MAEQETKQENNVPSEATGTLAVNDTETEKSQPKGSFSKTSDGNEEPVVEVVLTENSQPKPASPPKIQDKDAALYYANREDRVKRAEDSLKEQCVIPDIDGDYLEMFVLTEIDHWNHDKERIVLLCEKSVLSVNYSFITEKWTELTRVNLKCTSSVTFGELVFPKRTLQWPRYHKCLKIVYERLSGPTTVAENWNPFAKHLPVMMITSHPLVDRENGKNDPFDVNLFNSKLVETVEKFAAAHPDAPHRPNIKEEQIEMHVRLGLSSFVVNQSHLAYAKDRGGVHF